MSFNVHILGCGSATPSVRHLPSSQVVEYNGNLFMIDCGECAQLSFRRQSLNFGRLRHIFITHLHGDHVFGLLGLLSTLALNDMQGTVTVYIFPEGIELIKKMLETFSHTPGYNLEFVPLSVGKKVIYEDKNLTVETFPLCHRVPAVGFIFREKPKARHLIGEMLEFHKVPIRDRAKIKEGADFVTDDGRVIPNSWLTKDPDASKSYAYCSDTIYNPGVVRSVAGVDVLYHEATYADDMASKASHRGHSTARQAGQAAAQAGVERLIIGHFSNAYAGKEQILLKEAQQEFPNTILANEGLTVSI